MKYPDESSVLRTNKFSLLSCITRESRQTNKLNKNIDILVSLTDYPNSCCWCRNVIIMIIRLWFVKYVQSSQQWLLSEHDSNCLLCSVALWVYYMCNVCALHYIGGDCRAPLGPWRHIRVAAAQGNDYPLHTSNVNRKKRNGRDCPQLQILDDTRSACWDLFSFTWEILVSITK